MKKASALLSLLALTACSSPGDVQAQYDSLRDSYDSDMATAQEWNNHVLGIPASGWVPILILACLMVAILLGTLIFYISQGRSEKRAHLHALNLKREETLKAQATRGPCLTCGALPLAGLDKETKNASA